MASFPFWEQLASRKLAFSVVDIWMQCDIFVFFILPVKNFHFCQFEIIRFHVFTCLTWKYRLSDSFLVWLHFDIQMNYKLEFRFKGHQILIELSLVEKNSVSCCLLSHILRSASSVTEPLYSRCYVLWDEMQVQVFHGLTCLLPVLQNYLIV